MTIDFNKLTIFSLKRGAHNNAEEGVCAMEAVAWLEGLPHSDSPECTCPVIASYVRTLNDNMGKTDRQRLVPYLPRLVGTVSRQHERERAQYLAWQAIRVFAPIALRADKYTEDAEKLENFEGSLASAASAAYAASANASANAAEAVAYAAAYAASVASAAYAAEAAAAEAVWSKAFEALDGVLDIGPQSPGFSTDTQERVEAFRDLINA